LCELHADNVLLATELAALRKEVETLKNSPPPATER
jgi:hypothetical protein